MRASKESIQAIIDGGGVLLSRWRREPYSGSPFKELVDVERAALHFSNIAGRYELPASDCTLDIHPNGYFRNYGARHDMVGQATIAGVVDVRDLPASCTTEVPTGMRISYMCRLDRWYTKAVLDGITMNWQDLDFLGPGYQTFSVHAWLVSEDSKHAPDGEGVEITAPRGAFMENRPCPSSEEGWALTDNPIRSPWPRTFTWPELLQLQAKRANNL